MPPTTPSRLMWGRRSLISPGVITSTCRPKLLAIEAPRRNSSKPRLGEGDGDGAVLLEAGRLAGFFFQPAHQLGRVLGQLGHVAVGAQLADKPRRMPGGAGGELLALQQHHVGDAYLRQVIGQRTADDAAADNDDICAGGKVFGHGSAPGSNAEDARNLARAVLNLLEPECRTHGEPDSTLTFRPSG